MPTACAMAPTTLSGSLDSVFSVVVVVVYVLDGGGPASVDVVVSRTVSSCSDAACLEEWRHVQKKSECKHNSAIRMILPQTLPNPHYLIVSSAPSSRYDLARNATKTAPARLPMIPGGPAIIAPTENRRKC